jgi:peptidyl-prolyl cis-trans isomerase B (cyclophilin B)
MHRIALVLAAVLAALAGCGGGGDSGGSKAAGCTEVDQPPARDEPAEQAPPTTTLEPGKAYTVEVQTNCGDFTITLDQKAAPKATAAFFDRAKTGFYDDVVFHRIVPGFVIQGGDPTGTGMGGPGYRTVDTPPRNTTYSQGDVAMAKTAADPRGAAGSQFFVVTPPSINLAPDYAVVGRVSMGLDVVKRLGTYGDPSGMPTKLVVIKGMVATAH